MGYQVRGGPAVCTVPDIQGVKALDADIYDCLCKEKTQEPGLALPTPGQSCNSACQEYGVELGSVEGIQHSFPSDTDFAWHSCGPCLQCEHKPPPPTHVHKPHPPPLDPIPAGPMQQKARLQQLEEVRKGAGLGLSSL